MLAVIAFFNTQYLYMIDMKKKYICPASVILSIAPSLMLANSIATSDEHETAEQYSKEAQFDTDFDETDGWE